METVLLLVALAFAVVNGVNDGGALVAMALRVPAVGLWPALLLLAATIAAAPFVTSEVAVTLAERLVRFEGGSGEVGLLIATVVAVAVVGMLSWRGLPTSLTLAVVGAITGAGVGAGLPVAWGWVAFVIVVAAVAPLLGVGLATVAAAIFGRIPGRGSAQRRIRIFHRAAYGAQCLAYGLNDGQKMLAIAGIALGSTASVADPPGWLPPVIGVCFLVGAVVGLRLVSGTLGEALVPVRPPVAVVAEAAAAGAVFVSTALQAPVSMTQSVAGGLVGASGASHSYRRVRWTGAMTILAAWALTLPLAGLLAAAIAAVAV